MKNKHLLRRIDNSKNNLEGIIYELIIKIKQLERENDEINYKIECLKEELINKS